MRYFSTISLAILVLVGVTALAIMIGGQRRDDRLRQLIIGRWLTSDAAPGSQWTIEFLHDGVCQFNVDMPHQPFSWTIVDGRVLFGPSAFTIRELNELRFVYGNDDHPMILIRVR